MKVVVHIKCGAEMDYRGEIVASSYGFMGQPGGLFYCVGCKEVIRVSQYGQDRMVPERDKEVSSALNKSVDEIVLKKKKSLW